MRSSTITTALSYALLSTCSNAFTMPSQVVHQQRSSSVITRNMLDPSDLSQMMSSSTILSDVATATSGAMESDYSKVSYYTTLGLYVMSFPGLWSQIKRSTTAKLKRKTYLRLVMCSFLVSSANKALFFNNISLFYFHVKINRRMIILHCGIRKSMVPSKW